ncbi:hypothetical protein GmHk_17G050109 [Glycine max]|nr:hypothetical protein GmHk_17G050109 [Glycine max]
MYVSIMFKEVDMNEQNEEKVGVNEEQVDSSEVFNTYHVFTIRDVVLHWARFVAYEIGFVVMIMRSDTNTNIRGRTSFVLIGCEINGQYRFRKQDFVKRDIDSRKCGCPFKFHGKLVVRDQGWIVKLMCGSHNHKMTKSLVGHSYVGLLIKNEKIIIADMTRSMVKPINILLKLKEHNFNSYTTIKQIYNAKSVYRSSTRNNDI